MLNRSDRNIFAQWWWTVDFWVLIPALILLGLGLLLIMAASPAVAARIGLPAEHFLLRHALFLIPAVITLLTVSLFSHRMIRIVCLVGFAVSLVLIVIALFTPEVKGASRWIDLSAVLGGAFGFKIQPSEFAKPFFAVVTAWLLSIWRHEGGFPGRAISFGLLAVLATLLVLQPDMGMAALVILTWSFQIFLAGMPLVLVMVLAVFIAPMIALGAYLFLPHVEARIAKFLDGGNLQAENAMRSFSHGGLFGTGPNNGTVKYHLPDAHADFIFAVAGEEFGAVFCLVLIAVYGVIVLRGFVHANAEPNLFLILATAGLALQFGVQAAIHMASSTHLIPTKGMTLPMMSYGGSSLIASSITIGLLLALTRKGTGQSFTVGHKIGGVP